MQQRRISLALLVLVLGSLVLHAGTLARFRVTVGQDIVFGDIFVDLYDEDKPETVKNFKRLVKAGYYTNMFFHRSVQFFVVQGGGMWTPLRADTNIFGGYLNVTNFGPIVNEYSVGRTFSNTYGTIAMARLGGQPDSATSQFFFNLGNNSFLDSVDGGFTVFGRVISGYPILDHFVPKAEGLGTVDMTRYYGTNYLTAPLTDLPVNYILQDRPPNNNELFYCDITFLELESDIEPDGSHSFTWLSIEQTTNYVDCRSSLTDGEWTNVYQSLGTGSNITVNLTNSVGPAQVYRLRVDPPYPYTETNARPGSVSLKVEHP